MKGIGVICLFVTSHQSEKRRVYLKEERERERERERESESVVAESSFGELRVRKDARNGGKGGGERRSRSGFQMCELSCCLSLRWSPSVFFSCPSCGFDFRAPPPHHFFFAQLLDHLGIEIGDDRPQTRREATSLQPHGTVGRARRFFLLLSLLLLHIQSNSRLKSFLNKL